ncbi:hypothetical protein [Agreia sp. Leaf244]|uniref:hypothetical protein n=1 Tax=Agreia sp. Leaf244 TaxID=1736305 RepID=UPI00138F54DC|nr:hypothetical protein [Agreia sp. Leaf244]
MLGRLDDPIPHTATLQVTCQRQSACASPDNQNISINSHYGYTVVIDTSRDNFSRRRFASRATPSQQTNSLREGIYVAFTSLSVILILITHPETTATEALSVVAVTAGATVVAALMAELLSHMVVHDRFFSIAEVRHVIRACLGAVVVILAPVVLLALSALGLGSTSTALWLAAVSLVATLVVITALAVRGIKLPWWQRAALLLSVAAAGVGVLQLQILAHG